MCCDPDNVLKLCIYKLFCSCWEHFSRNKREILGYTVFFTFVNLQNFVIIAIKPFHYLSEPVNIYFDIITQLILCFIQFVLQTLETDKIQS